MEKRRSRNRFDTPKEGGIPPRSLTDLDVAILNTLRRRRYLTYRHIAPLAGTTENYLYNRMIELRAQPWPYIKVCDEQIEKQRFYFRTDLFFELNEPGRTVLDERGFHLHEPSHHVHDWEHQVLVDQIMSSFEIGIPGVTEYMPWEQIVEHEKFPEKTRQLQKPWGIPVSFKYDESEYSAPVYADDYPFSIKVTTPSQKKIYFFPGIEADCGTEPKTRSQLKGSSILRKFLSYLHILETRKYHSQFGFPNFFVPFLFPTNRRMQSMMDLLDQLTKGDGSKSILFKTHPLVSSSAKAAADGHMLYEPWQRVGHPPLTIAERPNDGCPAQENRRTQNPKGQDRGGNGRAQQATSGRG